MHVIQLDGIMKTDHIKKGEKVSNEMNSECQLKRKETLIRLIDCSNSAIESRILTLLRIIVCIRYIQAWICELSRWNGFNISIEARLENKFLLSIVWWCYWWWSSAACCSLFSVSKEWFFFQIICIFLGNFPLKTVNYVELTCFSFALAVFQSNISIFYIFLNISGIPFV